VGSCHGGTLSFKVQTTLNAELVGPFHDIGINTFISTADYISDMFESKLLRIQCAHYDNIVLHQNSKVTSTKNS